MTVRSLLVVIWVWMLGTGSAFAQAIPKYEMRGAWIATVINLDWPASRNQNPIEQQIDLRNMIESLHQSGINTVFFQVRSEADAMYQSNFEPWSIYLTGQQGRAPAPAWDPLAFAIEEAHKRGMELHAWFNPYRAERSIGGYTLADNHIRKQRPEWTLEFSEGIAIINPGIPDARQYVIDVIMDVVRNYDVDGVHFDDYFYPYSGTTTEDQATFATYGGPFGDIRTWRTYNINMFVKGVYQAIKAERPDVDFGISPFGIWRSGVPSGITGLSAVDVLYADALNWLNQGWVDYIMPQLYWAFGGGQDFAKLAPWWGENRNGRMIYAGHGLYRSERNTFSGTLFSANEIPRQVRFVRDEPEVQGSVFFRAKNLTAFGSKGFADSLSTSLYTRPSITPPYDWEDQRAPSAVENLTVSKGTDGSITLRWDEPFSDPVAKRYVVYRVASTVEPTWWAEVSFGTSMIAVTGETRFTDTPPAGEDSYYYAVTAASANNIESDVAVLPVVSTRSESVEAFDLTMGKPYPNPASSQVSIPLYAAQPTQLTVAVYDVLGRRIATPLRDAWITQNETITWDVASESVVPGTYFVRVFAGEKTISAPVVVE
ncbi:MAG: T9SS C-terminal target domain-containing protein [Bacteroidetes bacterium]|nr:T9SS C-terminal target domain-containing protein [Bacteroidota bacterium]